MLVAVTLRCSLGTRYTRGSYKPSAHAVAVQARCRQTEACDPALGGDNSRGDNQSWDWAIEFPLCNGNSYDRRRGEGNWSGNRGHRSVEAGALSPAVMVRACPIVQTLYMRGFTELGL